MRNFKNFVDAVLTDGKTYYKCLVNLDSGEIIPELIPNKFLPEIRLRINYLPDEKFRVCPQCKEYIMREFVEYTGDDISSYSECPNCKFKEDESNN